MAFEAFVIQNLYHHFGKGLVWFGIILQFTKEKRLNSLLESWGKINKFTPYSPDFNPIESFWSKLKNALRSIGARTYLALDEAIASAFSYVSLKIFAVGYPLLLLYSST